MFPSVDPLSLTTTGIPYRARVRGGDRAPAAQRK
jgi:hypothetical protein